MYSPRQIAPVGDRSPEGDPYVKDDLVSWRDIHGHLRDAQVDQVLPGEVSIRVGDVGAVVLVHPDELSPR